ncbi:CTLH/CRA C-terminal to lish motif domain-containing protein [Desarmillaria tabescens]|uniref:CTLH/CRA C-terminal to lish motif domain-containing protein n=1 Tax=Armillaria tabescens TaxID=1929756 RepID=A0AA39JW71_ARMTA|nr:CTLH/CRA C-terminal to lish motif domain-containing protein [Desarmillaria tabescens]KAK0449742.1 CTLH/CRA C-terminal to lish motif domain-containing protein [Desarmillaria tabescens]
MTDIEQPFTRVPYENYRRVFRTSQKHFERDFGELIKRTATGSALGTEEIDAMIARVEGLKRKLSDLQTTSGQPTLDVIRERLQHLSDSSTSTSTQLDRWLVDWALRTGKPSTARSIAQSRGIETLVDIDLFMDMHRIESALSEHRCTEALAWCSENKAALRKMKNTLEFDLRLQEYIEMCRRRESQDAIAYMRKYLVPWQETHLQSIMQAANLLAFRPGTTCGVYKRLYDLSRWTTLTASFRSSVYALNAFPTEPILYLALYAGLAALKLPACSNHDTRNVDCPVCDVGWGGRDRSGDAREGLGLGRLAKEVPMSHHANSVIVCRISGKIMDEDNGPMAFPDGHVYSREALEDMAARNNGIVTCPRCGTSCEFTALRKVFIS